MKRTVLSLLTMVAATWAIAQTTLTVPAPKCTAVTTVTCQSSTVTIPTTPTTSPPPVVTPAGTLWVYQGGVFNWPGDWSFNATVNYSFAATGPTGSNKVIAVTTTAGGGGWQPFAPGTKFDTSPYTALTYCVKPTQPGMIIGTGFDAAGDTVDGKVINLGAGTPYGPTPQANVWGCYKIPLKDFGFNNPVILKFTVATGVGTTYYVDNVGFTP